MKMYACKRSGNFKTIGTSWHFKGIAGFDAENCSLKCNKAERLFLLKAGFDVDAGMEEYGSMWLGGQEIKKIQKNIGNLTGLTAKEEQMADAMYDYMQVCLDVGYQIRIY